jgi:four helix bundle protein
MGMGKIENFYDLEAWKKAHELAIAIYKLTRGFPKEERFELVAQMRSSVSSVGANIAEGFGRFHYKDKQKFYYNARGSCYETQNHLLLAKSLEYAGNEEIDKLFRKSEDVARLVNGLIRSTGE